MKACMGSGHVTPRTLTSALEVSGQPHVPAVYSFPPQKKTPQVFTEEGSGCVPESVYIKGTQSYLATKPASQTQ